MRRLIIIVLFYSVEGFLQFYPDIPLVERDDGDAGEPLILTPYVESGNIDEGRRLAQVNIPGFENITSYSGFFKVDNANDSNQFFWYFPPMNDQYENASIIIWLQGGPGASSLFGLFLENGPIGVEEDKFVARNYSWTQTRHMIYIDNPVGTGFSFTQSGYCTNQHQIGEQLYSTVLQFLQLFPHLQGNDLYIAGESYGGKYAPALAYYIHKKNVEAELKINLKGVIIANGWSDPEHQLEYGEYLYQLGLIDSNQKENLEEIKLKIIELMEQKQWVKATAAITKLYTRIRTFIKIKHLYDYVSHGTIDFKSLGNMIQKTYFRRCIHVGEIKYRFDSEEVYKNLLEDMSQSVAPWIEELLDHYKVITYNGQLDIIVAYPLTVNYIKHLKFPGADEYKHAKREIRIVENEVAGYVKTAGNLTEIMIRDAGHAVPMDKPLWIYSIIVDLTQRK